MSSPKAEKKDKTNQGLEDSRTRAATVLDKTFYFADRELRMRVSLKKKKRKKHSDKIRIITDNNTFQVIVRRQS